MTDTQAPATVNEYGVQVGDIFYTSWGYDQTNINYYEVVRVTAKKAEVRPIGATVVEAHGPGGNQLVPNPEFGREYDVLLGIGRNDEKRTKLCSVRRGYQGEATIVLSSRHDAWRYTGGTNYATDPMFGH